MRRPTRKGFTIVEMLVAMALILMILAIIAETFGEATKSFNQLKAIGDMNERLRSAATVLRRDLAANHFEGDRRLANVVTSSNPTELGFFAAGMSPVGMEVLEGTDGDGIESRRGFNYLHMSSRLNGNGQDSFFKGRVPANSPLDNIGRPESRYDFDPATGNPVNGLFTSQWAEVIWFPRPQYIPNTNPPQQKTTGPLGPGQPGLALYNLYRRQFLLVPDQFTAGTTLVTAPAGVADPNYWQNYDISAYEGPPGNFAYNSPKTIQNVPARFPKGSYGGVNTYPRFEDQVPAQSSRWGDDLVLTNVVSFRVSVFPNYGSNQQTFENALNSTNFPPVQPYYPSGGVYDTAVNATTGLKAVKIEIRVWDDVRQLTRQVTIIQDM